MIKKVVLLAALLLLPSLALASPVTYTTAGSVMGSVPITFTPTSQSVPFTPFLSPIGSFAFNCSGSWAGSDTFTITLTQSVPGSGTGAMTATLTGIVAFNANGTGALTFGSATVITAAGFATTYTGQSFLLTSNYVPLLAEITQVHVPEPNAELLLGLGTFGLLGLAMFSRKKIVSC